MFLDTTDRDVSDDTRPSRALRAPVPDDVFAVGKRVYARALRRSDLPYLSKWADDPLLEEMVGSELFQQFARRKA